MACYKYKGVEYTDEGIIPVIKNIISTKSKSKRTDAQLNNRILEIYKMILESPKNYDRMMGSIDGDRISSYVEKLTALSEANKTTLNLRQFSIQASAEIKISNAAPKGNIAAAANGISDLNLNKNTNVKLKRAMAIVTSTDGRVVVFNKLNSSKESLLWDSETGKELSGKEILNRNPANISTIFSLMANAYLDAAGNPFIMDANFSQHMYEMVDRMLASGIQVEAIAALTMNPVVAEFIKTVNPSSNIYQGYSDKWGILSKKLKTDFEIEITKEELEAYGNGSDMAAPDQTYLSEFDLNHLENMIEGVVGITADDAKILLGSVSRFMDIAKSVRANRRHNSHLTKGGTHTVSGLQSVRNNIDVVRSDTNELEGSYGKEEVNGHKSPLGTAVERTSQLIPKIGELALASFSDDMMAKIESINGQIGATGKEIDNAESLRREMFTYLQVNYMKSFTTNRSLNESKEVLFESGKNSMSNRLEKIQNNPLYSDNPLVQSLSSTILDNGMNVVRLKQSKLNFNEIQLMQDSFNVLSNNDPEFAQDLIATMMLTTGLNKGRHSIVQTIPINYYLRSNNYSETDNISNYIHESLRDDIFSTMALRLHNTTPKYMTTSYINKNIIKLSELEEINDSLGELRPFISSGIIKILPHRFSDVIKTKNISAKNDKDANPYSTYISKAIIENDNGDLFDIYIRTEPLGYKSNGVNIKEMDPNTNVFYGYGSVVKSTFEENFLSENPKKRKLGLDTIALATSEINRVMELVIKDSDGMKSAIIGSNCK